MTDETFASFLSKKKEEARLSNTKLGRIANISAVYLGEIINGKKIPPDKKTQYALADSLNLSYEDKVMFFNLAASERGELPVDVYDYLLDNDDYNNTVVKKGLVVSNNVIQMIKNIIDDTPQTLPAVISQTRPTP